MSRNYLTRVDSFITPYLAKNGFTLLKSEFVEEDHNWYLRLYIDLTEEETEARAAAAEEERQAAKEEALPTPGEEVAELLGEEAGSEEGPAVPGVGINDCAKVARYLSKWLDKEDFIQEAYTLEVCSKGFLNEV